MPAGILSLSLLSVYYFLSDSGNGRAGVGHPLVHRRSQGAVRIQ